MHEMIPHSGTVVVFDADLPVASAFFVLQEQSEYNSTVVVFMAFFTCLDLQIEFHISINLSTNQ